MTPSRSEARTQHRARAEAASWIARLHGSGRTPAMERSWRTWLEARPENEAAWELATEVYAETGDLPAELPAPGEIEQKSRIPWAIATASLLALITVVVVGLGYYWKGSHTFQTALGERRAVILADGTRAELNTSSRIIERYSARMRTVSLEAGEVYFDVHADAGRPFVVFAGGRAIRALGTQFVIRCADEPGTPFTVILIEGRAAVVPAPSDRAIPSPADTGALTLKPGQRLRLTRDGVPHVETVALGQELAWMQGNLIFNDTPLQQAASEMNRYNSVKLRLSPDVPDSLRVSGIFRPTDLESFAASMEAQYGLHLAHDPQGLLLERTPP